MSALLGRRCYGPKKEGILEKKSTEVEKYLARALDRRLKVLYNILTVIYCQWITGGYSNLQYTYLK